jgi:beta-galactosidase
MMTEAVNSPFNRNARVFVTTILLFIINACSFNNEAVRRADFDNNWKFFLGDDSTAKNPGINDEAWRVLNLPHDWSIEGKFDSLAPAGAEGGALPGGIGWYRKTFSVPSSSKNKNVFIDFDGIYRLSDVWINGHYLGNRPNGYISFRYDLTPYLHYGNSKNVIAVRVDNAAQPNSRWYSGSGIYRHVWLVTTDKVYVDQWGTCITTPVVNRDSSVVSVSISISNSRSATSKISVKTLVLDSMTEVSSATAEMEVRATATGTITQRLSVANPKLWSPEHPHLYKAVTQIISDGKTIDEYITPFGIRYFTFDAAKGFILNGKQVKLRGVCQHHDLGALGAAVNTRAMQRQLEILKSMGCNAIRTSHNPPAPEFLDLCDQMGFIVMDEAFDMWKRPKRKFDYHLYWDEWHEKDLRDQILRDRNHPSIFIWSVGNEIPEQSAYLWDPETKTVSPHRDTSGKTIVRELVNIVRSLDATRPITVANDHTDTSNMILQAGVLDITSFNYRHTQWHLAQERWGLKPFMATESSSALESRGYYDMPSDSIRRWPPLSGGPFTGGNANHTCSSYDNCSPWWGSTHEESLKEFRKLEWMAGIFVWTGFDYLGEPTPYEWPSRSSYFGIIDLAGFPKDAYYLYQSVWTDKTVLHLFPHWNWNAGDTIDVWAYFNKAEQVELLLNERSLGTIIPQPDDLHVMWRVPYQPGTLKVVSRKGGRIIATDVVKTAGPPTRIELRIDRNVIHADGKDLSFIEVRILDADGNLVPHAENKVTFDVNGVGFIAGVDNGSQTSSESFKANERKTFSGMCLAIIQSNGKPGTINLTASSDGLPPASLKIYAK